MSTTPPNKKIKSHFSKPTKWLPFSLSVKLSHHGGIQVLHDVRAPLPHQCTGLRAVPQVHWTPSHLGALGAIWSIQTPVWHSSTSHC